MSAIVRGSRNAFRNPIRTGAVTMILGLSLGLVLVMFAARSAVDNRIVEVKSSIGNTVTISPAGARGFLGGGEPLTNAQVATVAAIPHITGVTATIDAQLASSDTTLVSAIEAGTLGGRGFRAFRGAGDGSGQIQTLPENFTPPIFGIGTNDPAKGGGQIGTSVNVTSGALFAKDATDNVAIVGKALVEKNSLAVGSTFTAYNMTMTVQGIYDAGNQFANNAVIFPIATLQKISGQTDQVTTIIAQVDSVDNLTGASSAISAKLGSAADVTSSEDSVTDAIGPLQNIRTIATTSLIGALIASAIIILLTMIMIVRERRKEIAVLKAIGAGDGVVVGQFLTEAVMLSLLGGVVGTVLGAVLSNPIIKALSSQPSNGPQFDGPGRGAVGFAVGGIRTVQSVVRDLQTIVDWHFIVYGLIAAIVVAVLGSIIPAWLIGKVRPAEVLRSE